jgi:hypothetical protein
MAIVQHLIIDQDSTFTAELTIYTDARYAFNLSDYTATAQLRRSPTSTTAVDFSTSISSPATSGKVVISLTDEQTAALKPGRWLYDVVIESDSGSRFRAIEGVITVNPSITRPTPAP